MPTALQFRRGTTSQNNSFTGVVGELSVDTDLDALRIHDGSTAGGHTIAKGEAASGAATTVAATANNSANETTYVTFVDGATGSQGIETDTGLSYNPSSGTITATAFTGALTGNVTGNTSGTAATVTTAAQTAITSLGTLTALQVDNININGNTLSSTAGTDLLITPLAGQQIVLDGAIIIDAGVVTGATSITSTAFVGALTGNVTGNTSGSSGSTTGNAATATALATARTIGGVSFNGSANISLPGVNTIGNQATSGLAATATLATSVTVVANNTANETVYPAFVDGATGSQGIETDTGLSYNPSTGTLTSTIFSGTATEARYADLAEKYISDAEYNPGTVMVFGGDNEVTQSSDQQQRTVAGIVSTNPAHLMNAELDGENTASVGLVGRVPCKVTGFIKKGDLMVTSSIAGHAMGWRDESNPPAGSIIGKSLENKDSRGEGVIEVVVGIN